MFDDLCDESRFAKLVATPQRTLGSALPTRGLFTSESGDPLWKSVHDILLPAFSMRSIRGYTLLMVDVADQMMLKWERLNPGEPVDVTEPAAGPTRRCRDRPSHAVRHDIPRS
jgi:cytochrome P450 / NADPH-cytochrome P450 reductase